MTDINRSQGKHRQWPYDVTGLLHPANAYAHPSQVLQDPDLTTAEMRSILAAWASDACVVEARPWLRRAPGSPAAVTLNEVLAALRELDAKTAEADNHKWKRDLRRWRIDRLRDGRHRRYATPHPGAKSPPAAA